MKEFSVHILASDNVLYQGKCESLVVPTTQGQYGILADHSNTICALVPGTLVYRAPQGENKIAAVSGGIVKIEDNDVIVLVDSAERPEDIDVNRAKRDADMAKEALLQKQSIREYHATAAKLARAVNRLKVKGGN